MWSLGLVMAVWSCEVVRFRPGVKKVILNLSCCRAALGDLGKGGGGLTIMLSVCPHP